MGSYPLSFHFEYKERQSRLTSFFRPILTIPWMLWLFLWGIAVQIAIVIAWFVLLFTAKFPEGLHSFIVSFMRYSARVNAWSLLLTDKWPSWGGSSDEEWGLKYEVQRAESYHRGKTFFRFVLLFPVMMLAYAAAYYMSVFQFLAWWAILFTGRLPGWCFRNIVDPFAWHQRFLAYAGLLIEVYPPFAGQNLPPERGGAPVKPAPSAS